MTAFQDALNERTNTCPAQKFLRSMFTKCVNAEKVYVIKVHDGEEWTEFPVSKDGIKDAAKMTMEIDGPVTFRIGKVTIQAMDDGPYWDETKAETIIDCNDRFTDIVGEIW